MALSKIPKPVVVKNMTTMNGDINFTTPKQLGNKDDSRIPRFKRSGSLRMQREGAENNNVDTKCLEKRQPLERARSFCHGSSVRPNHLPLRTPDADDDCDSIKSFGSACSSMSDYAFAKNGTTFSGRKQRYVVHCGTPPQHGETYLTPSQRMQKQIRNLKVQLTDCHAELRHKEKEILKLTQQIVQHRLAKTNDVIDETTNTDDIQKFESSDLARTTPSLSDSGNYDDFLTSPKSATPKDEIEDSIGNKIDREEERRRIVNMYERKLEEAEAIHHVNCQDLKEKYNVKVEELLQKLGEANTRYYELRPEFDKLQEKNRQVENESDVLKKRLEQNETGDNSMYLKMYLKGQEAAKLEHADQVLEFAHQAPKRVSVPELLQHLQETQNELDKIKGKEDSASKTTKGAIPNKKPTPQKRKKVRQLALVPLGEALKLWIMGMRQSKYHQVLEDKESGKREVDAEVTLHFLKSAVYYFFTDKENQDGHFKAIQSILGYDNNERQNIEKCVNSK